MQRLLTPLRQDPHTGRTPSHLRFRSRHSSHAIAVRRLFLGSSNSGDSAERRVEDGGAMVLRPHNKYNYKRESRVTPAIGGFEDGQEGGWIMQGGGIY